MTVIAPAVTARIGDLEYTGHVVSADVELGLLPAVDRAALTLPRAVEVSAAPGDLASLELTGADGAETVLTGTVHSVAHGLETTRVVLAGPATLLGARRPADAYSGQDATAVVRALASDADVDVGTVTLTAQLPAYIAHQGRTAAEHVAALAQLEGALAAFDADGALQIGAPGPVAQRALKYGRELLHFVTASLPQPAARIPVGLGSAGSASAAGALKASRSVVPASVSGVRVSTPVLRVAATASTAQQGAEAAATRAATSVTALCILVPALRPTQSIEVQDLPGAQSAGPFVLTRVRHRITPYGEARTELVGEGA